MIADSDSLLYQFLDIIEAFSSPDQVFDMISSFVSGCTDAAETQHLRASVRIIIFDDFLKYDSTFGVKILLYSERMNQYQTRLRFFIICDRMLFSSSLNYSFLKTEIILNKFDNSEYF